MSLSIEEELLCKLREKSIFSEYLPENFNTRTDGWNVYGAGASHKDKVEPYSYYMSRLGNSGDRRQISIPEFASYVSLVNFLRDNKDTIVKTCVALSMEDENSFSRFVNSDGDIVDDDGQYGDVRDSVSFDDSAETSEYEKERSVYIKNMLYKIRMTRGAAGILHIDISEFYKSIYTHIFACMKLGVDGAKAAFDHESDNPDYKLYTQLDDRVRRLNGARTNGLLVGPYVSRILSEALLAVVDGELREHGLTFTRYADDYEIAVYRDMEWKDVLSLVISVLDRYYFRVNNEKTSYEKYPFYIFKNYEKLVNVTGNSTEIMESPQVAEVFNSFLDMEKNGEKGAVRYLLKSYSKNYSVSDKKLYSDYLINVICNDEKNMILASRILMDEYKSGRIDIDNDTQRILFSHLQYSIKIGNNLEVVWLVYILVHTGYEFNSEFVLKLSGTRNELAIIVLLEEQSNIFDGALIEAVWSGSDGWILLYQIALRYEDRRNEYLHRLNITANVNFYNKLFEHGFSFYKALDFGSESE